ncbi:S100P-binding protein [Latimeria chalumnae]|uniref:S100P-binding protein n=1 Tax=Latimeria chalumnae TaxID=7897 RepID=UPI0003C17D5C|nr:PREDICTED: S100P-binding protein [Latimeria chalumnae]|eukprot:XP_005995654.1 PREDICTED: S100P-binding protein [Latimeria chalumnae]
MKEEHLLSNKSPVDEQKMMPRTPIQKRREPSFLLPGRKIIQKSAEEKQTYSFSDSLNTLGNIRVEIFNDKFPKQKRILEDSLLDDQSLQMPLKKPRHSSPCSSAPLFSGMPSSFSDSARFVGSLDSLEEVEPIKFLLNFDQPKISKPKSSLNFIEEELLDDSLLMCSDSEKGDSPFDYTEEEIQDILGFDEPSSKDLQDRKEEVMAGASQYEASSSLVVEGQESAIAQKLESTQDENMQDGDLNSKGHLDKTETLLQSTVPNNLSNYLVLDQTGQSCNCQEGSLGEVTSPEKAELEFDFDIDELLSLSPIDNTCDDDATGEMLFLDAYEGTILEGSDSDGNSQSKGSSAEFGAQCSNNQETKERLGIDNAEPANSSNSTNLKLRTLSGAVGEYEGESFSHTQLLECRGGSLHIGLAEQTSGVTEDDKGSTAPRNQSADLPLNVDKTSKTAPEVSPLMLHKRTTFIESIEKVKREILGEKHPPCDNSQVSLEKKMGKVIPILKPKPRKKANKKGEMESRKETYLQCVLSHVTDPTGGSQGTMSELLTLMDQVASVEYKNQNRLWQHPSDLTARNYPRFSEKPVVKCSLHQWAAENRYHQRFQYLRDQFQRSPVPARTPI